MATTSEKIERLFHISNAALNLSVELFELMLLKDPALANVVAAKLKFVQENPIPQGNDFHGERSIGRGMMTVKAQCYIQILKNYEKAQTPDDPTHKKDTH